MQCNTVGLLDLGCITSSHMLPTVSVLEPYIFLPISVVTLASFFQLNLKKQRFFHFQEQLFTSCSAFHDNLTVKLFTDVKNNLIATHKYHQLRSIWDVFTFVHCQCVTIVWLRDIRSSIMLHSEDWFSRKGYGKIVPKRQWPPVYVA
jgi:hypothetical protein